MIVAVMVLLWVVTAGAVLRAASALLGWLVRHPAALAGIVVYFDAYDGRPSWLTPVGFGVVLIWLAFRQPTRVRHRRLGRRRARRRRMARPFDRQETTLYRFFSPDGRLLYVGISNEAFRRIREHQQNGRIGGDWTMVAQEFPDRPSAEAAERRAIRSERPALNIAHRVG